jgi:VanZ family protein
LNAADARGRRKSWRAAWPVALALVIVLASSRPRLAAPGIEYGDKYGHFAVYGLLATLICRLGSGWRAAAWALVAASLFGVSDEWHQSFVPGRSTEVADWVADTCGAALAVGLYTAWHAYRGALERPLVRPRVTSGGAPVAAE